MPTSHLYQLNEIVELIKRTAPRSILDIGVGFGKYGFLAREYLDIWNERVLKKDWKTRIDGIEAFEDYIFPVQKFIYDHIYVGNALDVLSSLETKYDLIMAIDVIEHFEFVEGKKILEKCLERGRNVLVSTPKDIKAQGETHNNPYEVHKFQWRKKHFSAFPNCFFVSNTKSYICCFGEAQAKTKRKILVRRMISDIRNCVESVGNFVLGR